MNDLSDRLKSHDEDDAIDQFHRLTLVSPARNNRYRTHDVHAQLYIYVLYVGIEVYEGLGQGGRIETESSSPRRRDILT